MTRRRAMIAAMIAALLPALVVLVLLLGLGAPTWAALGFGLVCYYIFRLFNKAEGRP